MRSKIDPSLKLDDGRSVISVLKHAEHAIFLLEQIIEKEHRIQKIHFIPNELSDTRNYQIYGADLVQILGNKTVPGLVDSRPVKMSKEITLCSREEIFDHLKLTKYKGISFSIATNELKPMINIVNEEKSNRIKQYFNIKGKLRNVGVAHNCCTWVVEKAGLVGLELNQYLKTGSIAYWLELPNLPEENYNSDFFIHQVSVSSSIINFLDNMIKIRSVNRSRSKVLRRYYMDHPEIVNTIDDSPNGGRTVLHLAVSNSDEEWVKILMKFQANYSIQDRTVNKSTAIDLAIEKNDPEIIKIFFDYIVDGKDPGLAFRNAVLRGDIEAVKLLTHFRVDINSRSPTVIEAEETEIDRAIKKHDPHIIEKLFDPKVVGFKDSGLAFRDAVNRKDIEKVKLLTYCGVDINSQKPIGDYVPNYFVRQTDKKLREALLEAAKAGRSEDLKEYLQEYPSIVNTIDERSNGGRTALHWAFSNSNEACVQILIKKKAKYRIQDRNKSTAIDLAIEKNDPEIIKIFFDYIVDGKDPGLAFENAILRGDIEAVKLLAHKGVDINSRIPNTELTALDFAHKNNRYIIISFLERQGATTNLRDNEESGARNSV